MFDVVRETQFSSQEANDFIGNITAEEYCGDVTLVSTMRALFSQRINGGSLGAVFKNISVNEIAQKDREYVINYIDSRLPRFVTDKIIIFSVYGKTNDVAEEFPKLAEYMDGHDGYTKIQKFTEFFKKSFPVACFCNEGKHSTYLFIGNLDIRKLHYVQCSILATVPWIFKSGDPVDKDEVDLMYSMSSKEKDKYIECINKIYAKMDIRTRKIEAALRGYETSLDKERAENLERIIRDTMDVIQNLKEQMIRKNSEADENRLVLMGLRQRIAEGNTENELMEYVIRNKNIDVMRKDNAEVRFGIRGYLTYFDEEIAKRVIENKSSYVYRSGGDMSNEDIELVMRAIFLDEKIRVKFCAVYSMGRNNAIRAISNGHFGPEYDGYMPNPHIDRFSCIGNYEAVFFEAMTAGNYIGALEQCVASCSSLNFSDSTVMGVFIQSMFSRDGDYSERNKCIELPDGTITDARGAAEWLKNQ